jgi:hypothetical protein
MKYAQVWGGCGLLADDPARCRFEVEVVQAGTYVQLDGEALKAFVDEREHEGVLILSSLGEREPKPLDRWSNHWTGGQTTSVDEREQ